MKIALIYDAIYPWMKGGGEKALWEIATGLQARRHEVHLFGTKMWEGAGRMEREGVTIHGVQCGAAFYDVEGKRSTLQAVEFSMGLFRLLWENRGERFEVIYCTVFPYFSVFSVWLFRILSGQRPPWTLAWLEVWGRRYWKSYVGWAKGGVGAVVEWMCARCCPNHLVISPLQGRKLEKLLGVRPDSITLIPRGMDLEEIPQNVPKVTHRVIYAGRLIDYKNIETILKAWPKVVQKIPEVELRVIGSGPDAANLEALVKSLGITETVVFLPPLASSSDILHEIASAAILVQPSTREGQSVVVVEAMAAGTLVIAAQHPDSAVSDLIEHGKNGWLINEPTQAGNWSAALVQLLGDPVSREQMESAARRFAKDFDWEKSLVPRLEAYFYRLAGNDRC